MLPLQTQSAKAIEFNLKGGFESLDGYYQPSYFGEKAPCGELYPTEVLFDGFIF